MNMYMTTFIQNIIENCEGVKISPIFINRGWIEIDSNQDIDRYKKKIKFNLTKALNFSNLIKKVTIIKPHIKN